MKTVKMLLCATCCLLLTSCETLKEVQNGPLAKAVGSFELNPVQPNCYWYNGQSYDYNQYEIQIASEPCAAHIIWDGKYAGDTPFTHRVTGVLDKGERITVRAMPVDEKYAPQEASLKIREELPRQINFKLLQK